MNQASHFLYIGNLSVITNRESLISYLKNIGKIVNVDVILNDNFRSRRCFAIVEMLNTKEVDEAVEKLNGTVFQGRVIRVRRKLSVADNFIK
ncbi:MAG: hypothetical protein ACXWQQ_02720 [Pseudobdellovibrio sp.]